MDPGFSMRCMILCAGHGTRLGALTRTTPKPMLKICGRPILDYTVTHLRRHGCLQMAVNLHTLPEQIRKFLGTGENWGTEIVYSSEPELLGTAGAIKKMESFLSHGDGFLVQYGDVLTDQNLTAMMAYHRERRALATLLVHERRRSNSIVELDEGDRITGFWERPTDDVRRAVKSYWVNSGLYICDAEILRSIPAEVACDLPRDIFPRLVNTRRLYGFRLTGYRHAVDSPERLMEAESAVKAGQCSIALASRYVP